MMIRLGLAALLFPAFALAEDLVPITPHLDGAKFTATVPNGFHFNEAAPNSVRVDGASVKPKSVAKTSIEFALPAKDYKEAKASLYVCDDKLTFCQPESLNLKGAGTDKAPDVKAPAKKTSVNENGFIEDDFAAATAQALKEKKLVLADFSARWCPGCVRLETDTFNTKTFRDASRGFVKVHLDCDRFENATLMEKYKIRGIPAILALTAEGLEIARSVDFEPAPTLAAFMKGVEKDPLPFDELKKRADGGDAKAAATLGLRYYNSAQYALSIPYLEKMKPAPVELRDARVHTALEKIEPPKGSDGKPDPSAKADAIAMLKSAIAEEPASTRSIGWRSSLIPLLDEKDPLRQTLLDDGVKLADDLLAHAKKLKVALAGDPVGEFAGYERLYVSVERADLIDAAHPAKEETPSPEAIAAYKLAAKIGDESKISTSHLGPSMRYLVYLSSGQEYVKGEAWAKALLKKYPDNPEIERRLVRILNGEKKYTEAIEVGRKCLPHSYGRNEIWVAEQLTKAYLGAGEKAEAHKLVATYLDRDDLAWPSMEHDRKQFEDWKNATN